MTTQNSFFSKERRIEENRLRLKELYEQYKKTENYYPLFLAYITAFGIYIFDIISSLFNDSFPYYYHLITFSTILAFLYVLLLIWKFFKSVDWQSDYLPYGVYKEFPEEILEDSPELTNDEDLMHEELFNRYIRDLENFVENDLDIYVKKRNRLKRIWIPMIISLFIYSVNIITYKHIDENINNINNQQNAVIMSPKKIIINENKQNITGSTENKRGEKPQSSKRAAIKDSKTPKSNSSKKSNSKKQ